MNTDHNHINSHISFIDNKKLLEELTENENSEISNRAKERLVDLEKIEIDTKTDFKVLALLYQK